MDEEDEDDDDTEMGWHIEYSSKYSSEEIAEMRAEHEIATLMGLKWQERGPPGPAQGGPSLWRGQKFRPGRGTLHLIHKDREKFQNNLNQTRQSEHFGSFK